MKQIDSIRNNLYAASSAIEAAIRTADFMSEPKPRVEDMLKLINTAGYTCILAQRMPHTGDDTPPDEWYACVYRGQDERVVGDFLPTPLAALQNVFNKVSV